MPYLEQSRELYRMIIIKAKCGKTRIDILKSKSDLCQLNI